MNDLKNFMKNDSDFSGIAAGIITVIALATATVLAGKIEDIINDLSNTKPQIPLTFKSEEE